MLFQGRRKKKDVAVVITRGLSQYELASQAGYVADVEKFGARFLQDACWCSIEEPVIPKSTRTFMTSSGKYIQYGPGLTGGQFAFGSLRMGVDTACTGKTTGDPPLWLLEARSG